jgi:hypothetical protein
MEAPMDIPASKEVPHWSVENGNPARVAHCEEGDATEMTSGMLSYFPATFEVFSAFLSWAFLAFSSPFLFFSFSLAYSF